MCYDYLLEAPGDAHLFQKSIAVIFSTSDPEKIKNSIWKTDVINWYGLGEKNSPFEGQNCAIDLELHTLVDARYLYTCNAVLRDSQTFANIG